MKDSSRYGFECAGVNNARQIVRVFVDYDLILYRINGRMGNLNQLARLIRINYPDVVWVVEGKTTKLSYMPETTTVISGVCKACWETIPEGHDGEPLLEEEDFPAGWEDIPCQYHKKANTVRCTVWQGFFCGNGLGERITHCLKKAGFSLVENQYNGHDVPDQVWECCNPTASQRRLANWVNDY